MIFQMNKSKIYEYSKCGLKYPPVLSKIILSWNTYTIIPTTVWFEMCNLLRHFVNNAIIPRKYRNVEIDSRYKLPLNFNVSYIIYTSLVINKARNEYDNENHFHVKYIFCSQYETMMMKVW